MCVSVPVLLIDGTLDLLLKLQFQEARLTGLLDQTHPVTLILGLYHRQKVGIWDQFLLIPDVKRDMKSEFLRHFLMNQDFSSPVMWCVLDFVLSILSTNQLATHKCLMTQKQSGELPHSSWGCLGISKEGSGVLPEQNARKGLPRAV